MKIPTAQIRWIFFEASNWDCVPQVMEPAIHDEVMWANLDNLPDNMSANLRATLMTIFGPKNSNP